MSPWRGSLCSAINCSNNKNQCPDLSFFRFPKDVERSKKWVINSGRKDLKNKDVEYLYENIKLCSNHFESSQFMNEKKNKLVWNAVPTVFDVPKKANTLTLKRKLMVFKIPCNNFSNNSINLIGKRTLMLVKIPSKNINNNFTNVSDKPQSASFPETSSIALPKTDNDEVSKLKSVIKQLKKKLKNKNSEICRLRKLCKELKNCSYKSINKPRFI